MPVGLVVIVLVLAHDLLMASGAHALVPTSPSPHAEVAAHQHVRSPAAVPLPASPVTGGASEQPAPHLAGCAVAQPAALPRGSSGDPDLAGPAPSTISAIASMAASPPLVAPMAPGQPATVRWALLQVYRI